MLIATTLRMLDSYCILHRHVSGMYDILKTTVNFVVTSNSLLLHIRCPDIVPGLAA